MKRQALFIQKDLALFGDKSDEDTEVQENTESKTPRRKSPRLN